MGVRRGKVAFFSGCKSHPATIAPAGSNRSSHGGNEVAEAFGYAAQVGHRHSECRLSVWLDSAVRTTPEKLPLSHAKPTFRMQVPGLCHLLRLARSKR